MSAMKYVVGISILALCLTACDGGNATDPVNGDFQNTGGSSNSGGAGTDTTSTQSKLQGSWKRIGQYCGSTYSTGLAEQHAEFTDTQFIISLNFVCDNTVHPAQYYDVRYDHDSVSVEMTQSATGSCPMVYSSAGSPGWDTYTAEVLDTDSPATLNLTIGTCTGGLAKIDVYQKE